MVSIIIRTYNEEKWLDKLLESIYNQTYKKKEIIIVDSGSTDKTLTIAKKRKCRIVKIKKEDFSFGYSLNKGIEISKGEFCCFISGHCIPKNNKWLENLIKPFEDEKVGISYGKQIGVKNTKFSEKMIFKKWFPEKSDLKQTHPFCNNANAAIRKKIWYIKKFNEKVSGLEDLVLAEYLIKNTEYYLSYCSNSIVYHIHNETYKQIRNRYQREAITFSSIYENEKFRFVDFIKLTIINIFSDLKEFLKSKNYKFRIKGVISIIRFRWNQFLGTWKGYKIADKNKELRNRFYYPN